MIYVVIFVVVVILMVYGMILQKKEKLSLIEEKLSLLGGFTKTQFIASEDQSSGLAFDENTNKLCLIKLPLKIKIGAPQDVDLKVISILDVVSVELYENGVSLTKTNRSSQIGGALIGGIALGGVGAVIGGLSGSTTSSSKINRIELRLIINDMQNPVHDVCLLKMETTKNSFFYNEAMNKARHWYGLLSVLIKNENENKEQTQIPQNLSNSGSVAEEIRKLSDLKESGIISEQEFLKSKEKLLSQL